MSAILKTKTRGRLQIMAHVLQEALNGSGKSRIMYRSNLSYRNLEKYLRLLLTMQFLKEVKKGKNTVYETTGKGLEYLEAYRKLKALMLRSGEKSLKSETADSSEKTSDHGPISQMGLYSEIANLKTRVKRLEKIVPLLKFCPTCGKEIRQDFRLCPFCGENLSSKMTVVDES